MGASGLLYPQVGVSRTDALLIVLLTLVLIAVPGLIAGRLYGLGFGLLAAGVAATALYAIGRAVPRRKSSRRLP